MGVRARSASLGVSTSEPGWRATWTWSSLVAEQFGRTGWARFGRVSAWVASAGFGVALLARPTGTWRLGLAGPAFETLAWLAGFAALGVATDLSRAGEYRRLVSFSAASGFRGLPAAIPSAAFRTVARALVPQSALLAALPLLTARDGSHAWVGVRLWVVWTGAVVLTAALWALLARWAVMLHAASPRRMLLGLVFGPLVVGTVFGGTPSLASWVDAAAREVRALERDLRP